MSLQQRMSAAEERLFTGLGLAVHERFLDLPSAATRLRVLSTGAGTDVVLLHGVSLGAAVWAPWAGRLAGYRAHLVDLPGHGLSGAVAYRPGAVRVHAVALLDDLLDVLGIATAAVIGHSLGGMFALWHAVARPGRIASFAAIGAPAAALPGARARMPLTLMNIPVLGPAVLRSPAPRPVYRRMFGLGMSPAAAAAAPAGLLDALRFAVRLPGNAQTVGALMHALNGVRRARPGITLTGAELSRLSVPALFCWGSADRFLAPGAARASVASMPNARLHELPAGHGPWFEDPGTCAGLVIQHLSATGFPPGAARAAPPGAAAAQA